MAPYRHWYIPGAGDYGVHVQAADDAIGHSGVPGAYVHNDGKLACLDADGLGELARAAAEAAADVRRRIANAASADGVG